MNLWLHEIVSKLKKIYPEWNYFTTETQWRILTDYDKRISPYDLILYQRELFIWKNYVDYDERIFNFYHF